MSDYPIFKVEFDKEGEIFKEGQVNALVNSIGKVQISDLIVMSHGWKNDTAEASDLYKSLRTLVINEIEKDRRLTSRKFAFVEVYWPSKKFADRDLIPSGGAASDPSDISKETLKEILRDVKEPGDSASEKAIDQAIAEVDFLDTDDVAGTNFVRAIRDLLPETNIADEPEDLAVGKIAGGMSPAALLEQIAIIPDEDEGKRTRGSLDLDDDDNAFHGRGSAASLGFDGILEGARNLLNLTTYYQMKDRAGKVGEKGLNPMLLQVKAKHPECKLHLIGHSFGARVVTSALAWPPGNPLVADTLTLLQAAFSHFGFATKYDGKRSGAFVSVLNEKVKGPIIITHTRNDTAVGKAYAIASRLAGQVAAALGDEDDEYGGLGANGAQKSGAIEDFELPSNKPLQFASGKLCNLRSDCINDHNDICRQEVAMAIAASIATE